MFALNSTFILLFQQDRTNCCLCNPNCDAETNIWVDLRRTFDRPLPWAKTIGHKFRNSPMQLNPSHSNQIEIPRNLEWL